MLLDFALEEHTVSKNKILRKHKSTKYNFIAT